ncbi:MAG: DUF3822 family protein [Chitinophagaceae bacterium]
MKQVFHISSESTPSTGEQVLAVRTGEKHFGFAVTSPSGDELYKLAWYTDASMEENTLQEIYQSHPELGEQFSKVIVCFDHPQSVLVPQVYYNMDDAPALLKTLYGTLNRDLLMTEYVQDWQIQNVYSAPRETAEWISRHFSDSERCHTYTIGLKNSGIAGAEDVLSVDIRPDNFSLIVTRSNKLLLAQTYAYATPADVLYYLLNACRQFSLTQETAQLVLSGLITQESALYRELYNYFLNIQFRESGWNIQGEQQYPAHFFTSLNDLVRCAS